MAPPAGRRRAGNLGWAALLALLTAGCGFVPLPEAPPRPATPADAGPGGREQPLALSPKQEYAVGLRAYREIVQEYGDRLLPAEDPATARVRRVTDRLIKAAEIEPLQREILLRLEGYRFDWEAKVIQEEQVNAFCLPAGKIFVFTGILPVTDGQDALLAAVLAHEMAHALAHHASERLAREKGGGVLRKLAFNRDQEAEADHVGVFLMAFAGYDPAQAVAFWERMERATAGRHRLPEILSDHPSDAHRVQKLREWAPRARAAKQAFDAGRVAPASK